MTDTYITKITTDAHIEEKNRKHIMLPTGYPTVIVL